MSKEKDDLSEIDLTKFMKGFGTPGLEPGQEGELDNETLGVEVNAVINAFKEGCYSEERLGCAVNYIMDVFADKLTDKITDLFSVFDEKSVNRILDGFAMRLMKEMNMEMDADI